MCICQQVMQCFSLLFAWSRVCGCNCKLSHVVCIVLLFQFDWVLQKDEEMDRDGFSAAHLSTKDWSSRKKIRGGLHHQWQVQESVPRSLSNAGSETTDAQQSTESKKSQQVSTSLVCVCLRLLLINNNIVFGDFRNWQTFTSVGTFTYYSSVCTRVAAPSSRI